ncbi:hypothetical protein GN244_ATG10684 [Phytophthora infestans]|uniref:Uncharacterized protein n=1 Tax=Phytophthora infestans TaxID=4787 RepID=A0A833S0N0_PHYIN|nr:hypothetical protein GN244_ATG10684 [Phytophthora infestans]
MFSPFASLTADDAMVICEQVKKTHYRHLRMSYDGQKVFAATSTVVHVFDAASCQRFPCCLRKDRRTIFSLESGSNDNSIYLVYKTNLRKVCKYAFIVKKGLPQFRKVGEHEHNQEMAAFTEGYHHIVHSNGTGDHVVLMIDICARFTVVDLIDPRSANNNDGADALPELNVSALTLPFNPPSERYNVLHTARVADGRIFAFAVWSTGFCIMEILLSDSEGRLPCGSFNGEVLKRYGGFEGGQISIYQQVPSPQVVLLREGIPSFRFTSLQGPTNTEIGEGGTLPIADYVIAADSIVALSPHGLVRRYNLFDNRFITIAQPFESSETTATVMINLFVDNQEFVVVGDSMGVLHVFSLDMESRRLLTRKQAYANDSVAVLIDRTKSVVAAHVEGECSLLSVSRGGEVKHWQIKKICTPSDNGAGQRFMWELITCFRTYSSDISAAAFEFPQFLFCGFDSGSVECWSLPSGRRRASSKSSRLPEQAANCISVVKRALHAIDLHLAPVRDILCESGAGTSVLASPQPVTDNFSWVFSYDEDAIILVWCFSLSFFFPHRRIKVHEFIKGIYISPANGFLDLFAYVDRNIDRVDHLGSGDKEAVKQRLLRGRERAVQRELKPHGNDGEQPSKFEARRRSFLTMSKTSAFTPESYDGSRLVAKVPSVRIDITLPGVEHSLNSIDNPCPGLSPATAVVKEPKPAPTSKKFEENESNNLQSIMSSSPTRLLDRPPLNSRARSPHSARNPPQSSSQSPRRNKLNEKKSLARKAARDAKANFLPREHSLRSRFQQAKPRLYRSVVNPSDSLSSQARCAVISAGDAYSSLSPSCDGDPNQLGIADRSGNLVRSSSMIIPDLGAQEKVSVVSLVEYEDKSILLLDYQPRNRHSHRERQSKQRNEKVRESLKPSYEIPFMQWERMSEHDRRVELMAACKSRCVQEDAEREGVFVPRIEDFESEELAVQLGVRSFTRWFAAMHRHHQRIRERFLTEELMFAAIDPTVHQKVADVGLSPPPVEQIGQSTSTAWQDFVSWYCLGPTELHQTIPPEELQRERLEARTDYLELRLRIVSQSELEVQEEEEKAGPCEEKCQPPQQVFIFEHFVKRLLADKDSPTSWENMSLETQQKEIMLALMDPVVQIAAMRNDFELPDISGSCTEDIDILALAGKFVPWWAASLNIHRRDFLEREAHEASINIAILGILEKEQNTENGESPDGIIKDFFESYFRSETARLTFLKNKLSYFNGNSRIASVVRYEKLPAPLVTETLPLPLVTSFDFDDRQVVAKIKTHELIEEEFEQVPQEPEVAIGEQATVDTIDNQREQEKEELQRLEDESANITLELMYMAQEDALSREYNDSFVESDEEIEEPSLVMPNRTDFSQSYFFGNLPAHYRKVTSSGWRAGSGVDNGDEEFEEEEQLERERERQRLLEEQEAERLLELERQAERARIEKEREEKAFQFRRVRQAELRKVLQHQADLEVYRKADLEFARERAELNQMQREDEHSCWHRDQLLRDQTGMRLEDEVAFWIRKVLHKAAAAKVRQLLQEQASMSAEDQRSSRIAKELRELERDQAVRTASLSDLYTPFRPFYQFSAMASEDFLPQNQWKLEQERLRRTPVKPVGCYTIPLEEALVFDELDQEPYLARDSRKFKLLMGLPLRTPCSQKRPRIPKADDIIAMRQQQRKLAESREERQETLAKIPQKGRSHTQVDSSSEHSRLPSITPHTRSLSSLTELKDACRKRDIVSAAKHKTSKNNQQQQQNQQKQSLPFFRGNMLVQGHGQARSGDNAY